MFVADLLATFVPVIPSVVGTVGRASGQVRLRVVKHTDSKTITPHFIAALVCCT